jgi:hypothetical protein
MRKRQRQRTRNRLARARLNSYCREANTSWPSRQFLESFEADVRSLSATNRVTWKTLQRLDERLPSLRIALRIDNVANRAIARLEESPQAATERARPLIQWLVKIDHPRVKELGATSGVAALEVREQLSSHQDARLERKREAARLRKKRKRDRPITPEEALAMLLKTQGELKIEVQIGISEEPELAMLLKALEELKKLRQRSVTS